MYWLIRLVNTAFMIYRWIVLARIIMSWLPEVDYNPMVRFVYKVTEPVGTFRQLLPAIGVLIFRQL